MRCRPNPFPSWFVTSLLAVPTLAGCVHEEIPLAGPTAISLFKFRVKNPSRIMEAGSYHGTNLFFEIDLKNDLSPDWVNSQEQLQLQLQFITPKIDRRREIYEVGKLHRVVLSNARWEVGGYRYLQRQRSRLYVFKEVPGDFSFFFRGQEIVIKSRQPWIPSVYYYFEEAELEAARTGSRRGFARRQVTREVVQVGLSSIELFPRRGVWQVDGKPFHPTADSPLELSGSVKFTPPAS